MLMNRENFTKHSLPRLLHEYVKRNAWVENNATVTPGFFFSNKHVVRKLGSFCLLSVFRLTLEAFPSPLCNNPKQTDAYSAKAIPSFPYFLISEKVIQ